jgi:hypothetical protein
MALNANENVASTEAGTNLYTLCSSLLFRTNIRFRDRFISPQAESIVRLVLECVMIFTGS